MRWLGRLRGGGPALRREVEAALAQARAGRPQAAIAAVSGHFPQALGLLEEMGGPPETAWLQLAARLLFRAGRMREAAAAISDPRSGTPMTGTSSSISSSQAQTSGRSIRAPP